MIDGRSGPKTSSGQLAGLMHRGYQALGRGEAVPARRYFAAALEVDPGHEPAWQAWQELAGDPAEAMEDLACILGRHPGHGRALQAMQRQQALAARPGAGKDPASSTLTARRRQPAARVLYRERRPAPSDWKVLGMAALLVLVALVIWVDSRHSAAAAVGASGLYATEELTATPEPVALPSTLAPASTGEAPPAPTLTPWVVTAMPQPDDVFAAATLVVQATLQALQAGTPTPTPPNLVTATPTPPPFSAAVWLMTASA
jgi:hypothetical protein